MIIRYDEEKLKKIIRDITAVTGITMAFIDTERNYICKSSTRNESFCSEIQSTPQSCNMCRSSDEEMVEVAKKTKAPYSHVCHAGITDTVVPILREDVIVGYVIIGRIRRSSDFTEVARNLSWAGENELLKYEKHYLELAFFTEDQLKSLISLISNIIFEGAIEVELDSTIATIVDYIDENIEKDLSVDVLCQRFFLSKNSLYKAFRAEFDKTVNDYVTDRRIELATVMLRETKDSVRCIAERIGFYNYTYFTKLFKQRMGVSPKGYRLGAR